MTDVQVERKVQLAKGSAQLYKSARLTHTRHIHHECVGAVVVHITSQCCNGLLMRLNTVTLDVVETRALVSMLAAAVEPQLQEDALITYMRLAERTGLDEKLATFLVNTMGYRTLKDLEDVSELQVDERSSPPSQTWTHHWSWAAD